MKKASRPKRRRWRMQRGGDAAAAEIARRSKAHAISFTARGKSEELRVCGMKGQSPAPPNDGAAFLAILFLVSVSSASSPFPLALGSRLPARSLLLSLRLRGRHRRPATLGPKKATRAGGFFTLIPRPARPAARLAAVRTAPSGSPASSACGFRSRPGAACRFRRSR